MKAARLIVAFALAWLLCAPESRADAFGNRAWGKSEYQSVITPSGEAQTLVRYRENPTGYDETASGQEVWTKFDPLGEETEDQYETDEIKAQEAHDSALKNLDAKDPDHDAKQKDIEDRYKDRMSIDQKGINLIETSAKEMHVDAKTLDDSSMDFKMHQLAKTAGILGDLGMMADGAGEAEVLIAGGKELIGEMLGEDAAESGANALADTSNLAKPLGLGSTGRTAAADLQEQLAMKQAMSNPAAGRVLQNITMSDARWPASQGWVKMSQNVNGVEIHYVQNTVTGAVDDFKFK